MTTDEKIRDEKLQCDINIKTAKIASDKIDKPEYLAGEEILPSDQRQTINKPNLNNFLFKEHSKSKQKTS